MKLLMDPVKMAAARYLDFLSARQKVIAANIANIDTPGYRVKDLTFQQEFLAAQGKEMPGQASMLTIPGTPSTIEVEGLSSKNDGNNVRLDREMSLLSENSIKYSMMVQMLLLKEKIMRSAVSDGRK